MRTTWSLPYASSIIWKVS